MNNDQSETFPIPSVWLNIEILKIQLHRLPIWDHDNPDTVNVLRVV